MTASGIRVGTPSVTTQGMVEGDMKEVANLIVRAVKGPRRHRRLGARGDRRGGVRPGGAATPPTPGPERRGGRSAAGSGRSGVRAYLLVMVVAAAVTFLVTPLARRLGVHWGAMTAVRDRDVHAIPTPRLGGIAMLTGFAAATLVASRLPFLSEVFENSRDPYAILSGAVVITLVGVADDRWDLDAVTKLAGQVLAAGVMVLQGVQMLLAADRRRAVQPAAGARASASPS